MLLLFVPHTLFLFLYRQVDSSLSLLLIIIIIWYYFCFYYFWYDSSWSIFLLFQVRVHPSSSHRENYCFCCSTSYNHIEDATVPIIRLLIQFWSLCCHCPSFPPSQILTRFDQASCSKCHFHHIHLIDTVVFWQLLQGSTQLRLMIHR